MSDQRYVVDWADIERAFPPGLEPPALLRDFAGWLGGRRWGSVGCFDLAGSFSDDAPIVDGPPLRREFALFIHLPDGSKAGFWLRPGHDPETAPVVGLGSEGELAVLAGSLEGWLARLALNTFDDGRTWSDFAPSEMVDEDETEELAAWLGDRLAGQDLAGLGVEADGTAFVARMEAWMVEREAFWAAHPATVELARLLSAHRPTDGKPWSTRSFRIGLVGDLFEARVLDHGPKPFKESAAIEPVLRDLRDAQARSEPDLGLWFGMTFGMTAEGVILPYFDYETRPVIDGAPAPVAQGLADLARAPRPSRWVPRWLTEPDDAS